MDRGARPVFPPVWALARLAKKKMCSKPDFGTFRECHRSARLWELALAAWRSATGETKVKTTDRIVLFGDRSGTWLDESEEAAFAGLEEPFAILHKVTLHVIHTERNKDAAPKAKRRRTVTELYQKVQSLVQRLAAKRWRDATIKRHHDGGAAYPVTRCGHGSL